jgi:HK97 family phage prohead protease
MDREAILAKLTPAAKRYLPHDGRELRTIRTQPAEAREDNDGQMILEGHAAVFNEWTVIGGFFQERVAEDAFKRAVIENDVRLLLNHSPDGILARTKNGTLELSQDEIGLHYRGVLNPLDPFAISAYAKIARGDIDQSSFAFRVLEETWEEADTSVAGDLPKRTIVKAELFDVSPVTYPAYEGTDVGARAAHDAALGALSMLLGLSDESREELFEAMTEEQREAVTQTAENSLREDEGPAEAAEEAPAEVDEATDDDEARDDESVEDEVDEQATDPSEEPAAEEVPDDEDDDTRAALTYEQRHALRKLAERKRNTL